MGIREKGEFVIVKKIMRAIAKSSLLQSSLRMFIIAACIILGGFIAIYENRSNAKIVAREYFQCYLRNDFKEMYKYVDVDETDNVNYESFKKKLKNEKTQVTFADYTVSKAVKKKGISVVTVSYTNGYTNKKEKLEIKLLKKRVAGSIFPRWKVVLDDWILSDVKIKTVSGESFTFDGKKLTPKESVSEKDSNGNEVKYDVYKLDKIFSGTHDIYLESTFTECSVRKNIKKSNEELNLKGESRTLKDEYNQSLGKDIDEMVVAFFNAQKDKSGYKVLDRYFAKETMDALKKEYKKVKKILYKKDFETDIDSSLYVINSFDLSDVKVHIINFSSKGEMGLIARCSYSFSAKSDTSKDDLNFSSYVSEYEGKYDCDFNLRVKYDETSKKYIVTGIEITNTEK